VPAGRRASAQKRGRVRGCVVSIIATADPPHPNPLPCGEREHAVHVARSCIKFTESGSRPMGARKCLACGACEPVADDATLWPPGWSCTACGHTVAVVDGIPHYAPSLADSLTGFDPANFDELAAREDGHFWFEPRNRLLR